MVELMIVRGQQGVSLMSEIDWRIALVSSDRRSAVFTGQRIAPALLFDAASITPAIPPPNPPRHSYLPDVYACLVAL